MGARPEHVKADAFGQFRGDLGERLALPDHVELGADFLRLRRLVDAGRRLVLAIVPETGEDILGLGSLVRLGRIGPEDGGGVADLDAVAAVLFKKAVQCGRVGEGRSFRNRGVVSLLMPIGREGIEIERDDGSTGRLCSPNSLDRRMQACDRRTLCRKRGRSPPLCLSRPRAAPK